MNILLIRGKNSKHSICCNQLARAVSSQGDENTSCLDSVSNNGHSNVNYQTVHPGKVSPGCFVPNHIERPSYAVDSSLSRVLHNSWLSNKFSIEIKSEEQIRGMRDACRYHCCRHA